MSKLKSLPSTHEQHKIPLTQPIDRLYYLDLALPNNDNVELVRLTAQTHSTSNDPHLAQLFQYSVSFDVWVLSWHQENTKRKWCWGLAHPNSRHHSHWCHSHPPSPEVTKTIKTIHDVLLHWTMPNLSCQHFACCWEPISYLPSE